MLTRQENELMSAVYEFAHKGGSCLISPSELLKVLPEKSGWDEKKLNKALNSLELDDYFDVIDSDRKGEKILCINLHAKGFAYKRVAQQSRRNIYFKIAMAAAGAIISFVVGKILIGIFS